MTYSFSVSELREKKDMLHSGDRLFLSGTIYTARDAAHKRIAAMLERGDPLPFALAGAVIYYAGPTPARNGGVIGSCGPTTSCRMDLFTPRLYDEGLLATIGKGQRSAEVKAALRRNGGLYLCAVGGAGALMAQAIKAVKIVAFPELGCEAVRELQVENLPLFVGLDTFGGDIYNGEAT